MEDTQAVDWDVEEEEEDTERSSASLECSWEPVGRLRVFSGAHGPEKDFPLFLGKNVVGRLPECSVALPFPSISKQHAVIDIPAWNKAPILQDCGSLNGTQILRPPKVLSPGMRHRLRDQELVLFADLPCQYHRLHVSLPFVSRGPLTVEETPRVQGGTQPSRPPLAEDSEEEIDFISERCMVRESRSISSPLSTIVPESDEEGPGGSGRSFPFSLDSDTDEEDGQQPAAGGVSWAAKKPAPAGPELPAARGATAGVRRVTAQPALESSKGKGSKRDARNGVVLGDSDTDVDEESSPSGRAAEVLLGRARPPGFMDSDTDSEEGIPATPAVVPMKRHVFRGGGTRRAEAPGSTGQQDGSAGSETDVEEEEVPLQRRQTSMVMESTADTDDKEDVSAALALAHLREGGAVSWNRDAGMEEDRAQPALPLEESPATPGRDSDTDLEEEEEEGLPAGEREAVPNGHADKDGALVTVRSEDSDADEEAGRSSPGICLERGRAPSTAAISLHAQEVPPGPAVRHREKPVEGADQAGAKPPGLCLGEAQPPREDGETDMEEGAASAAADLKERQQRTLSMRTQGGALGAQVEPVGVHTGTPGEPSHAHREGAPTAPGRERQPPVGKTKDLDSHDDSEDLDLQATQCFLQRDSQSLGAAQTLEDEPTQAFLFAPPQESGSSQTPGTLDESWEVLATQPFCPREAKASEPQPIATHLEAHGCRPSLSSAAPLDQHPESAEPLGTRDRQMQTVEKDMGTPKETERGNAERGPLERAAREGPPEGGGHDGTQEAEAARGLRDREQKQLLARATRGQGAGKNSASPEGDSVEMETSQETQEEEVEEQTHAGEAFEIVVEKAAAERERELAGAGVTPGGEEMEGGGQARSGQASSPTSEPGVGAGGPSSGGRGAPLSPKSQQRGLVHHRKRTPEPAQGGPESSDAFPPPAVPQASALPPDLLISQNQEHPAPQPLPQPPSEPPRPPELEASHPQPSARPRSSRKTPSPLSSAASEPHPAPTGQPTAPEPTPQAPRGKTRRSSVKTAELQPSAPTDQPVTPKPAPRATRGRTRGSSASNPKPVVPIAAELQPVTPKPTSRSTQSRMHGSPAEAPDPVVPTGPESQPSTSTVQPGIPKPRATRGNINRSSTRSPEAQPCTSADQPGTPKPRATRGSTNRSSARNPEAQPCTSADQPGAPKPTSRATRGRTNRSSAKNTEPVIPTAPAPQPSLSTVQPVTPKPTSHITRGRTSRSSVDVPEPTSPTNLELQPSAPTEQPITPTSADTQDRTRGSSAKTTQPVVPPAPGPQPPPSTDQPVTPKPRAARGRKRRSSARTPEPQPSTSTDETVTPQPRATRSNTNGSQARTPEPSVPPAPGPQPPPSTGQPVAPNPAPQVIWGETKKFSAETPEPAEPPAREPPPSTSTDRPVTPKPTRLTRGRTRRPSMETPEPPVTSLQPPASADQPAPLEPGPQASGGRRQRAAAKPGALTAPPEPESRPTRNQRTGALRAAESLGTIPEPSCPQPPETPTRAPQKVETEGRAGFTPEPQPKTSQSRKRPSATVESTPPQKRLQRGDSSQKVVLPKEEDAAERPAKEEDAVVPGPSKRKRDQEEEEPKGTPNRSLRRTKPNQEPAPPRVLFTGVLDARGERAVLALGGTLASSVAEASHLVTDRIRRTVKFLCALGRGIPILSLDWLHQSRRAGCFLPPDQYLVTDPEQEMNFGFNLRDSLNRARERRLLEGYEVYVTPGVQPPPPQMGEIICCCGGTVLSSMPRSYKPQRVVITCPQDFSRCSVPSRVGLPLLSPEFLLTGVLKQEAKPEAFILST